LVYLNFAYLSITLRAGDDDDDDGNDDVLVDRPAMSLSDVSGSTGEKLITEEEQNKKDK